MDMLERYLQAVRVFLPARQQDDIVRELSENLISQVEDREEELGRPLTEDEQADLLRRHGHPMSVAGRYRQQQYLIGPAFFPIYLHALKLGVAIAALVTFVLAALTGALRGDAWGHFTEGVRAFPGRALMVFAWTTFVFAVLDMAQARFRVSQQWDPRKLPRVVRSEDRIPRLRTLVELAFSAAFVVWLVLLPKAPFLILGPAAAFVAPAPIWSIGYPAVVLLSLATVGLYAFNFFHPEWTRGHSIARIAISVGGVLVAAFLLRTDAWFVARALPATAVPDGMHIDLVVRVINMGFHVGVAVTVVINLFEITREAYRLKMRARVPPNPAPERTAH